MEYTEKLDKAGSQVPNRYSAMRRRDEKNNTERVVSRDLLLGSVLETSLSSRNLSLHLHRFNFLRMTGKQRRTKFAPWKQLWRRVKKSLLHWSTS